MKKGMTDMTDKELFENLSFKRKNVYEVMDENAKNEMNAFCEDYKAFLNKGKTERECVAEAVKLAEANGYEPLSSKQELKAGDKVYAVNRKKNILLAVIGSEDITNGINIAGAHIDSPRLI